MNFRFTVEEENFRQEIREFLKKEITEGLLREIEAADGYFAHTWEFIRKLGARGWLTPSWPQKYGGLGLPHMYTTVLHEELDRARVLPALFGALMVGPAILRHATSEEQKSYYLPRIARGEIEFALGYSEPHAGTDLASAELSAVEKDGQFILNGQKMFCTGAHYAQYIFLLSRTDPSAPKHQGLSMIIVDVKSPGITVRRLKVMGFHLTNEVFFDDVRVPVANLVGERNRGWYYIVTALNFERVALSPIPGIGRDLDELIAYAQETKRNGQLLAQFPEVRYKLAQLRVKIEAARMLSYRVACMQNEGVVPFYESDMVKVFQAELHQELARVAMEVLGLRSQLKTGSPRAPLQGWFEHLYRTCILYTFGGGSSEINRNIIARRGLGLPEID